MIFLTVGTHEQPFNRLIKFVDELIGKGFLDEEVFMQVGYSTYKPIHCDWKDFISYNEMNEYMEKADTVITHGGPATFMKALSLNKRTIVVPRLEKFNEHVNNHQLDFANKVKQKNYKIIVIEEINDLSAELKKESKQMNEKFFSNTNYFNDELISRIYGLLNK